MIFNIFAGSQESVKPVSSASGSHQRELIDQTSEQEGTWQQETTSPFTEKLPVNERKRKRQPHDHNYQENLDLDQVLYM